MTAPAWVRLASVPPAMAWAMPKSATFTCPLGRDQDVAGLDVAVHDAVAVGEAEGGGHVGGDLGRPARVQRALGADDLGEAAALDVLHDDEVGAALLAPVVDGHDVGVVEVGRGLRLAAEPLDEGRVLGVLGEQDLDRDGPVEQQVPGQVHVGHAAPRQAPVHLVAVVEDGGARRVGHTGRQPSGGPLGQARLGRPGRPASICLAIGPATCAPGRLARHPAGRAPPPPPRSSAPGPRGRRTRSSRRRSCWSSPIWAVPVLPPTS